VSLAGPAVNVALAAASTVVLRVGFGGELDRARGLDDLSLGAQVAFFLGFVNVLLAVFNLLPIPPLDGSALVERVLPARWWPTWVRLRPYGMGVVLVVVLLVPGFLDRVFEPALDAWSRLL
jgi:Zn-dependent protease